MITFLTACGRRPQKSNRPQMLIVGGVEAPAHSYPWVVGVYQRTQNGYSFICGGAVINELWVLCAAHCVVRPQGSLSKSDFQLRFGAHNLKDPNDGFFRNVSEVFPHESYRFFKQQYDIALFKIEQPLQWSENLSPLCLPTIEMDEWDLTGNMSTLVGWGTTQFGANQASPILREVQVPITNTEECAKNYSSVLNSDTTGNQIGHKHICAGYPEGGKDTCQVIWSMHCLCLICMAFIVFLSRLITSI